MKYTGRLWLTGAVIITGALFKINAFVSLGYIPLSEWILNAIFMFPAWWCGLQYDKSKFFARELKKKDDELNQLFNSVDAVIYSFDFLTKKLMVSSKVSHLYGYSSDELKEKLSLWKEVIHPKDIDKVKELEKEILKGKGVINEYRILLPNGELKWVQKRITPIFDVNRSLIMINGIDIDITHQKKVEELLIQTQERNRQLLVKRLEETEQRFKSLFIHNSDAIFTYDLEWKLIEINQATEKLIGYSMKELQTIGWNSIIVPEDRDRHKQHYTSVSEEKTDEITVSIICKDGRKREVSIRMIPIMNENEMIGTYEIAKDITDAKLAEEMIRRSDKLSAVGQLAAGVAHEIRNPLTTLKGFVQLHKPTLDKRYVNIMLAELDRINQIVSEFLILAKPQGIKHQLKDVTMNLQSTISLLKTQAIIKNIQIHFEYDLDIPLIKCEQNQLKQVFINLLKNAIESMENGGEITVKAKKMNEEMITILIIDQGIGIPEEQIPKLGEPFYTTKVEGTGLGLMVCFRIIENHGGSMKIFSELNKGTSVEVCIPINHHL